MGAREIVFSLNSVAEQNAQIKKWKNAKADQSVLQSLNKQLTLKIEECKTYVKKIEKLNNDIQTEEKNLANKQQEGQKNDSDIKQTQFLINLFRNQFLGKQTINDATVARAPQPAVDKAIAVSTFVDSARQRIGMAEDQSKTLAKNFPRDRQVLNGSIKQYAMQMAEVHNSLMAVKMSVN